MSISLKNVDVITLFVEDLQRSKSFYQDVFDLAVVFEDEDSAVFKLRLRGQKRNPSTGSRRTTIG